MTNSKYNLSYDEVKIIVYALVELKNQLIEEGHYGTHAAFFTLFALFLLICITVCASALTVPAVTVDSSILTVKKDVSLITFPVYGSIVNEMICLKGVCRREVQ